MSTATKPPSSSRKAKSATTTARAGGWKTCSRGHNYRGPRCPKCWPGGANR